MLTAALYQALEASPAPPSVKRSRVPLRVALPLSSIAPAVKPLPRFTAVMPEELIVYVALEMLLLKKPLFTAMASTVVVLLTVNGAVYTADAVVGVVPLVV